MVLTNQNDMKEWKDLLDAFGRVQQLQVENGPRVQRSSVV